MAFTTRKLSSLVKLMSNKNIAEERTHPTVLPGVQCLCSPRRHSHTPEPQAGQGIASSRPSQGVWAGQIPSPLPEHSQEGTKEARKLWDTHEDDESTLETRLHPSATAWVWARFLGAAVERSSLGGFFGQEALPWAVAPRWRGWSCLACPV